MVIRVRRGQAGEPLHRFKAGLFKTLGNPLRLRILELLRHGEMSVRDLLVELGLVLAIDLDNLQDAINTSTIDQEVNP